MPSAAFTLIRSVMRPVLADNEPGGESEFADAQLDDAIKAVFFTTDIDGLSLNPSLDDVIPASPTVRQIGIVALEACWIMVVGDSGQISYRTRAFAQADSGQRKRDVMQYARERLRLLKDGDAIFASTQTLAAFLASDSLGNLITVNPSKPPELALNLGVIGV